MTTAFFDAKIDFKKLDNESSHLDNLAQRVSSEGWPKDPQDSWIMLTAMAASIERCYSGSERIIKNLLQELDGSIPSSNDWHRQLIDRAASVGPYGRPPLFDGPLAKILHDLRSFRHRERNSYMNDLDPAIVLEKAGVMVIAVQSFRDCINLDNEQKVEIDPSKKNNETKSDPSTQIKSELCQACRQLPCTCGGGDISGSSGFLRQRG